MKKLFVITGAGGGLGTSLVKEAAGRGYTVEAVGRTPTGNLPDGTGFTQMDCTDSARVMSFWQGVGDQYAGDTYVILINNAGKYLNQPFEATSMQTVERTLADNFLTSVNMTKGFLDQFESGTIVNLNSFAGLNPRANQSVYSAAKAALRNFYASLRRELPPGKFRILNLYPYRINTWSAEPEPRTIQKEDAARWIIDVALLDGSFEIADCTIVPFGAG